MIAIITVIVLVVLFLSAAIRILKEYERGVIFRLGRVLKAKGPGLIILIPIVDRMVKVSLRLVAMDVDPQDIITRDNVSVKVNAVIYFRVIEPVKAVIEVEYKFDILKFNNNYLSVSFGNFNNSTIPSQIMINISYLFDVPSVTLLQTSIFTF